MKRMSFIVLVLVLWLSTCQAPQPQAPDVLSTPTNIPATDTAVPPTPTEAAAPQGKLPAPPFPAKVYVSKAGGFALDYPDGWTVSESAIGDRATQVQFLSSPDLASATTVPAGQTRLTATTYQWDPKNDLAAYVAQQKTAWEASGFSIVEEQPLTLELGLQAVQFTVQTPEAQTVFLVTALQDQYLILTGEGDLELVKQIVQRLRPISP